MREKILQVKTFGSFSMIYDGKSLFGRKVGETQFASMMQMLIHERKKGVSRDRLEQELFGEREVENVHHALQSVIYNAKKRLAKRLEESICTSIRNSDVVNHYSKGQYLVLLINTTREDCAVIQKRINYKFLTDRQRTGVRYYVNSVVYEKDL